MPCSPCPRSRPSRNAMDLDALTRLRNSGSPEPPRPMSKSAGNEAFTMRAPWPVSLTRSSQIPAVFLIWPLAAYCLRTRPGPLRTKAHGTEGSDFETRKNRPLRRGTPGIDPAFFWPFSDRALSPPYPRPMCAPLTALATPLVRMSSITRRTRYETF